MLTNSAKLLKKFLVALMLTSALFLASCGVTRTSTTSQRTHSNSATTATTDSVGATTSATHDLIKAQVDSLFEAAFKQRFDQEREASIEQTLHLLLFDTTQPADTTTGLPPVKAAATATTTARHRDKTRSQTQADVKAELTKEQTDSTQTVGQSTAHVKTKAQSSQAANSESAAQAKTKRGSWRLWAVLALVTSVLIAVCAFYLRRKIKLNKQ